MRDEVTKRAFIRYLLHPAHADQRFWQAVRNFSGETYILRYSGLLSDLPAGCHDTFFDEADLKQPELWKGDEECPE